MPNVGYATIQIIPSVRGISDELRRQLVGPAADAGDRAGQASGGGFREAFGGALAAIGITEVASKLGEQFTEAFSQAMEQANVTSTLQAQLGASGKDAAKYGAVVGRLYAKGVTENFEQGAETVRAVVNAGLVPPGATTKQLDIISTKMTDVANTFGTDMSMQTQAVSALLKNGLAPSAGDALDVITVGLQKLGPNAEDLLETFQEYPVQLRKLGLDSKTALGLFQQGLQGGARDTDIVADALKEFSIRSIDMSNSSRAAYKSLGLDASALEQQIAKGGSSATAGLQTVLDKLRGIHDPVKREAAAVGLFGTQAEELGTSLFKLDPSKASKTFSTVGGAADQLGKTLRSGPSYEITVFKRTLQQGLVNFIGGQVLPILSKWGATFNKDVLPPLKIVGGTLSTLFLPTLSLVGSALSGTINWFREWGIWLVPLGIAIGGVTLALNAQAIATGLTTAVFSVYRAAILIGTAVTSGFTAAQAALNAVMALNPFVLVAIALVALGAALVIAWKKSETFRDIVMGAWKGIQTAAMWTWNNVLKPAFEGIKTGLSAVGAAFSWLWSTVIKPVFAFIDTAARILLTVLTIVVFGPIYLAVKQLGVVFSALWTAVISPTIGYIKAGLQAMWAAVKVVFGYFMAGLKTVGGWFRWLWNNAVQPVLNQIKAGIAALWNSVKLIFGYFTAGLKTVGGWFKWLWTNGVKPAFDGIKNVVSTVWRVGIKPVFDSLKTAVGQVGKAFNSAKDAIKVAWDKVKGIAKAPVQFIVDTVYNRGIVGVWNKVAGAFGAPKLSTFKFATGGILPGYTPGRDVHLAALSGGEAVMRPEWTRAVGPGYVNSMNAAARSGGVSTIRRMVAGGTPAFADGGIFGWVKGAASKGVDLAKSGVKWLKDGVKASAVAGLNQIVKPLLNRIAGSASAYRNMISGIPKRMLDTIVDFSGKADKRLEAAGIGGANYKRALSWARTQAGLPYQWGGNGNPSWDCSGFVSAIESVIRGQKPHRRWATGAFSGGSAPSGWVRNARSPYMIGITNAGVGHTAGTLNGVNVESRGGDGVIVGSRARGYNSSLFTARYGFKYDNGGWLQPGATTAMNATGQPEAVLTASQWKVMSAAAQQGAGGLQSGDRLTLVVDGQEFHGYVDARADGRVQAGHQRLISVINAS
ncbi:phage tail tape measure protein [Streptomyces sp. NPDC091299]|uniref:phage tail tape measure protein n=1 Tax=Streptomyces sp. NPDC091299 TaxID=3155302 RepID=UPI00343900AE